MSVQYSGDKITFADGSIVASGWSGFKNRILNGDMRIDQRNAGASVTPANATLTYITDRWFAFEDTDGVCSVQQITDAPTGFVNSLRFTTTTADSSLSSSQRVFLGQRIEGFNVADLGWGTASASTVTLSFWVKSSLTGTFGGALENGSFNRSYPFTYTISAANTWEQKSVTIAGDTTGTWATGNTLAIQVAFGLGVGTDNSGTAGSWAASNLQSATGATSVIGTLSATWQVAGVQLEKGSTATSFDYRPYGTELALCQRYYQKIGNAPYAGIGSGIITSIRTGSNVVIRSVVDLRAVPTVNYSNIITTDRTAYDTDITSMTGTAASVNGTYITFGHSATGTAGYPTLIVAKNGTTGYVSFDSEL